jgi:hypothetical protein
MQPARSQLARKKLIHAVIYFVKHMRACHKVKLFKLLCFLDFEIYRQTGRSVTGLDYFAWPMGPVPTSLHNEIDKPKPDLDGAIVVRKADLTDPEETGPRVTFIPKIAFDESVFTGRELEVMVELAETFRDADARAMIKSAHEVGDPWHQVYEVQGRRQDQIPYALALDSTKPGSITKEQADLIAAEARILDELFK